MKKFIKSNVWFLVLGICLLTILGFQVLETDSLMEVNLMKFFKITIDARK